MFHTYSGTHSYKNNTKWVQLSISIQVASRYPPHEYIVENTAIIQIRINTRIINLQNFAGSMFELNVSMTVDRKNFVRTF